MDELHASTVPEFLGLLKKIRGRSGLSLPKIAGLAGLPRSQAYSMLSRGNLPTKPEQVRAFVTTCGLPEPQVVRVMELWAKLQ
ncbi:helix-turn-helix domain-containing protein [Lentzea sp. CA-135723]|uniref:helix-turn-helix domain-containing protein n=1 Tax=Lentzea sp. CA-135723 TaxID=3239950 RepID=UPI003D93A09F